MKRILITNDDGIDAAGIEALYKALADFGEIYIVAPDREKSACSHTLSLKRPLRIKRLGERKYSINGTPTDAVFLALNGLFKDVDFDLVASGINSGGNMGQNLTYSGTVGAAMEAVLNKIPSLAVSINGATGYHWETGEFFARKIGKIILKDGMPNGAMLNVNIPNLPLSEIGDVKVTKQGRYIHSTEVVERVDPRGEKYYWVGGLELGFEPIENSDILAVSQSHISVTPIHLDFTDHNYYSRLLEREW